MTRPEGAGRYRDLSTMKKSRPDLMIFSAARPNAPAQE